MRLRSGRELALLAEAAFWLSAITPLLKPARFKRVAASLGLRPGESIREPSAAQPVATAVGAAVATAARRIPRRPRCLAQALATVAMLRRRAIPGTLYLGAARGVADSDLLGGDGFVAHAWVRCGDSVVVGDDSLERYAVIARFTWADR